MQTDIKDLSTVQKQIKVTLPAPMVQTKMEQTFQQWQKHAKIKGFRPGKAPLEMVRKQYKEDVEKEVVGELIRTSLTEVFESKKLQPVDYPVLEERKIGLEGALEYSVTVEVKPELKVDGYKHLKLTRDGREPGQKEVDNVIDRMRDQQSVLKDKEAKQAKAPDFISMNASLTLEGKSLDKSKVENRVVPLGENYLLPEIEAAIPTMTVGETRDIEVSFKDDHNDKLLAGKKGLFTVTLNGVKEKIVPDLSDDFAKATGEATTLADLKEKILKNLQAENKQLEENRLQATAINDILNANPFEVPPSMVRSRYEHLLQRLVRSGVRVQNEDEAKKIQDESYQRALAEVRADLVLEAIATQEGIKVEDSEVDQRINAIIERAEEKQDEMRKLFSTPERRGIIYEELLRGKTLAFILSKATIKDAPSKPMAK